MSRLFTEEQLQDALRSLGIWMREPGAVRSAGFPWLVRADDGSPVTLETIDPGFLQHLDPDSVGAALFDSSGTLIRAWGLAERIALLKQPRTLMESSVGGLIEVASAGGQGAVYLDGYRFFASHLRAAELTDVLVMVVDAQEERQSRRLASKNHRMATTLKRLGNALSMNQSLAAMSTAACHEIASACELAAVLLWVQDSESDRLMLSSAVGANRLATSTLGRIQSQKGTSCAAELVAATRQPFRVSDVARHELTESLEAKFCYLQPRGLSVHPLVISGRLLGVLELVGREGDSHFEDNAELFTTIAEHLALAINSSLMFETFERLASRDALTGLANHRALQEFLFERLADSQRNGNPVGVLMIDVDHFRAFNEEEGHDMGDEVLRAVGEALKSCLRPYDLAARYGGEEFTVVLAGASLASLRAVAERIRLRVQNTHVTTKGGKLCQVTISLGGSLSSVTPGDASTLLKAADIALYEAKRSGRNRVVLYDGPPPAGGGDRGFNIQDLRSLLEDADWDDGSLRLEQMQDEIHNLSIGMHLNASQQALLEGLIRLTPTARQRWCEPEWQEQLRSSGVARSLNPGLESLASPGFVGTVPRLAKAALAILMLSDGEDPFASGELDAEIQACLLRNQDAA